MKNRKKYLVICLCLGAVITATVMGTLAYLTDQQAVANTFTVGQVDISVDEASVNQDGTVIDGAERVTENQYHLIPGQTYTKDPTMTVKADSEEAYVRMLVTLNCKSALDTIFAPVGVDLTAIFNGYDANNWIYQAETVDTTNDVIIYEFRYKEMVSPNGTDIVLDALFDSFTVPGTLDGTDLKSIENLKITVEGHAIQATGFATEDAAWAAFTEQHN